LGNLAINAEWLRVKPLHHKRQQVGLNELTQLSVILRLGKTQQLENMILILDLIDRHFLPVDTNC